MTKEELMALKPGDTVYVKCVVDSVFVESGLVQVCTKDCQEGFDAYAEELEGDSC